ncbi:MAG: peroxiredoxin-like family protein [Myxococcota bacterium]|nr:peroxiredoxin-like family protein [Myxococcota bacterium]
MFCREQAARIAAIASEVEALGAQIYAIGNGTVQMAEQFAAQFNIPFPLLTDPSRRVYAAAGMKRNLGLGPSSILKAGRAMAAGHRQGITQGDVWQQGGVVVLSEDGQVLLSHADTGAGDHLSTSEILQTLRRAPRDR